MNGTALVSSTCRAKGPVPYISIALHSAHQDPAASFSWARVRSYHDLPIRWPSASTVRRNCYTSVARKSQILRAEPHSPVSQFRRRFSMPKMNGSVTPPKSLGRAVIAFGSNMGDRVANIEAGLSRMKTHGLNVIKVSSLYETRPMYYDDQDAFLNGVCQVETSLEPLPLLDVLQSIENDLGRKRIINKGPRTIDLDIILYNQQHIKHPRLEVPHKLMLEREFVLRPLAE